jgi:hypothetical protein
MCHLRVVCQRAMAFNGCVYVVVWIAGWEEVRAVRAGGTRDVRDFVARVGIGAAACHCGDVVWCGFACEVPIAGWEGGRWGEKMGGLELLRLPRDWGARADEGWRGWGE